MAGESRREDKTPLISPALSTNSSENSSAWSRNGSENSFESGYHDCTPVARVRKKRSIAPPGRPPYSYVALIFMAISSTLRRRMILSEIHKFIADSFPYYITCPLKWRSAIRHNLTLNDCFVKLPRDPNDENKSHYWTIDPASESMFENGSFRRRHKRFKREQELGEVLPALVERTYLPKVALFPQFFQPFPYPTMASLPGQSPIAARRGFGINDILAHTPRYGPTPNLMPTSRQMMSYLPPPCMIPYYSSLWATYPPGMPAPVPNPIYSYPYTRAHDETENEQYTNTDVEEV